MYSKENHRQLLWSYRQRRTSGKFCSPQKFLTGLKAPDQFKLDVIAIDWEVAMDDGCLPDLAAYTSSFPYLEDVLRELFSKLVSDFVRDFRPEQPRRFGMLNIPDFKVEKEIARGGMGVVYQAQQISTGRDVALKFLFFSRLQIHREAELMRSIDHPNVSSFVSAGRFDRYPFLAMGLAKGKGLDLRMQERHFDVGEAVSIISDIADGLAAVHSSGVVHLDVKPANVVIDASNKTTLIDFGVAKQSYELWGTRDSLPFASPAYCSPEQLDRQFGEISLRSDIYSLGLILYELLTGRRMHVGKAKQLIEQIANDPPRRPSDYNRRVSAELEAVCLKAIQVSPDDRYSSMSEFSAALKKTSMVSARTLQH